MMKLSLLKVSLTAFSGVAVLMLVASLTAPANAAVGGSKFRASPEELRRHCWRIDETFWMAKRRYGCGEITCASGSCRLAPPPPPPPTYPPPQFFSKGDGGNNGGGARGAGGESGGQQGGSSGAPN